MVMVTIGVMVMVTVVVAVAVGIGVGVNMKQRQRMIEEAIKYQKQEGFVYWTPITAATFCLKMLGDQPPATETVEKRKGNDVSPK